MNVMTGREPVLGHILAVTLKADDHRAAVERAGGPLSVEDQQPDVDRIADMIFIESQRFLSDRRPSTVEGVAALLDFALSDVGQYVLPHLTVEGRPFLPALMRVCADTLAKQCRESRGA